MQSFRMKVGKPNVRAIHSFFIIQHDDVVGVHLIQFIGLG